MDTKAPSDRSMTLMHYLARVLRDNFPDLLNFVHELTYLEKSATGIHVHCIIQQHHPVCMASQVLNPYWSEEGLTLTPVPDIAMVIFLLISPLPLSPVSLDLLAADARQIAQGMKQTLAEFLQNKSNKPLKKFCFEAEPLATKLETDLATAREAFGEVVQYFGENPKLTQPNSVFPVLQRFVAGFQVKNAIFSLSSTTAYNINSMYDCVVVDPTETVYHMLRTVVTPHILHTISSYNKSTWQQLSCIHMPTIMCYFYRGLMVRIWQK